MTRERRDDRVRYVEHPGLNSEREREVFMRNYDRHEREEREWRERRNPMDRMGRDIARQFDKIDSLMHKQRETITSLLKRVIQLEEERDKFYEEKLEKDLGFTA